MYIDTTWMFFVNIILIDEPLFYNSKGESRSSLYVLCDVVRIVPAEVKAYKKTTEERLSRDTHEGMSIEERGGSNGGRLGRDRSHRRRHRREKSLPALYSHNNVFSSN